MSITFKNYNPFVFEETIDFTMPSKEGDTPKPTPDLANFTSNTGRYLVMDLKDSHVYPDNFDNYYDAVAFAESKINTLWWDYSRFAVLCIDMIVEQTTQPRFTTSYRTDLVTNG